MSSRRVVVIGHGVAGLTAAQAARAQDPGAEITIVGGEPFDAYYRPRLSHDLATGIDTHRIRLRPPSWYESQRITVLRETLAVSLDAAGSSVTLDKPPGRLGFDSCVLACGSRTNLPSFSGCQSGGVMTLRSAADAETIRQAALGAPTAAIAGGGLLGLEVAYGLAGLVHNVVVLERGGWLLRRQLDREGGEFLATILSRAGIAVWTGAEVAEALPAPGPAGVRAAAQLATDAPLGALLLRDGRTLEAALLVICAGVRPSTELAKDAGLEVRREGVLVDDAMRTSEAGCYACGDMAAHPSGSLGIWPQAMAQGRVAGTNAAGGSAIYRPVLPQAVLEVAGTSVASFGEAGELAGGSVDDQLIEVGHRDDAAGRYARFRLRQGKLSGAMLIGWPELAKKARAAVEEGMALPEVAAAEAQWRFGLLSERLNQV